MSRLAKRTLVVFTVLVFLLMIAFAALSWTAENPLRFRVVAQGPVELAKANMTISYEGERVIPFEVEVTNTKPYAIHLRTVTFLTALQDLAPEIDARSPERRIDVNPLLPVGYLHGFSRDEGIAISMPEAVLPGSALPAHSAHRYRILVREVTAGRLDWSKVRGDYDWESWSKCLMGRLLDWTRYHLPPGSVADSIPVLEEDHDEAMLENALPKP